MNKGHICDKCGRVGFSLRGLRIHESRMHPHVPAPVPAPRPPSFKEGSTIIATEDHNLMGGQNLDVGDVIWFVRKAVILKIEKEQGETTVKVEAGITKRSWRQNQPW
jgi:hypothetical protein